MRRIYRAFPELDSYSDEQCELLMKRVDLNRVARWLTTGMTFVGIVVSFFGAIFFSAMFVMPIISGGRETTVHLVVHCLIVFITPAVVGAVIRDHLLKRQLIKGLKVHIDRIRCPQCMYVLFGLPVKSETVSCPECGVSTHLKDLGVVAEDMVPVESAPQF